MLGLVVECQPIEAFQSILELIVPHNAFTLTLDHDMKVQTVQNK